MSFIDRLLKETVTYWRPTGYNEFGDPVLASPGEIDARWEDKSMLFIDKNGDEKHSRAVIFSTTGVLVGGYLYRGSSETMNPETVDGADQIRRVEHVRDIKNQNDLYKIIL
mgnify:FL=1